MVSRIIAVLILVAVLGGGIWYFLRDTPSKEASRLWTKTQKLLPELSGFDVPDDWAKVLDAEDRRDLEKKGRDLKNLALEDRLDLARGAMEAVLKIYPTSEPYIRQRARIEASVGNFEKALDVLERFRSFKTEPPGIHLLRAEFASRLGRYALARSEAMAAADENPFGAYMLLGKMALANASLAQAEQAMRSFERALETAKAPREDPSGQKVDAQLRLSAALTQSIRLRSVLFAPDGTDGAASPKSLKERRSAILEEAAVVLNDPQCKIEPAARRNLLADVYEAYDDPLQLEKGIQDLEDSIAKVEVKDRHTFVPVYLRIGTMALRASERPGQEPRDRDSFLAKAEANFRTALEAIDTAPPAPVRRSGAEDGASAGEDRQSAGFGSRKDRVLFSIADSFLSSATGSWRILRSESEGRKDPLDLKTQIERIGSESKGTAADAVRRLRAVASIRNGQEAEGEKLFAEIAAKAGPEEKARLHLGTADLVQRAAPDSLLFLKFLKQAGQDGKGREVAVAAASLRSINRAIGYHRSRLAEAKDDEAAKTRIQEDLKVLDGERKAIVAGSGPVLRGPEEHLGLAVLLPVEEGISLLRAGRDKALISPDTDPMKLAPLREQLAQWLGLKAEILQRGASKDGKEPESPAGQESPWWDLYRESLAEDVALLKESPYRQDLLIAVRGIIGRFKASKAAPVLDLSALLKPVFPEASAGERKALGDVFDAIAAGGAAELLAKAQALKGAEGLRPYGTLILCAALSEEVRKVLDGSSGGAESQARAKALRDQSRALLEDEKARSPGYLPLRIELARLRLEEIEAGKDVGEDLLKELRDLASADGGRSASNYQIQSLQALALKKRYDAMLQDSGDRKKEEGSLRTILLQRRTVLRRAIEAAPGLSDPYLSLAETYLGGLPLSSLGADRSTARLVDEPDYERAVSILRNSPEVPSVLLAAGEILLKGLKRPKDALVYYARLAERSPGEGTLRLVLGCYSAMADPDATAPGIAVDRQSLEGVRKYLDGYESWIQKEYSGEEFTKDFPLLKSLLLAMAIQDEIRRAAVLDAQKLRKEAIGEYRKVQDWSLKESKPLRADVANNLAWLLGAEEGGTAEERGEALKILEEVLPRIAGTPVAPAIEDTYGWILYRKGDFEKAEAVYRKLMEGEGGPKAMGPTFAYHFGAVLLRRNQYTKAQEWMKKALDAKEKFPEAEEARKLLAEISNMIKANRDLTGSKGG